MRRKVLALTAIGLGAPSILLAQAPKHVYRIAILDDAVESARSGLWRHFRNRLRELVLKDGNDVAYEARYASGATERMRDLAAELVALKPDIVVCAGTPGTIAAMKTTSTIPIVFVGIGDPVGAGVVASLAHPGGNATGTSIVGTDIMEKQFELLREMSPGIKRVAMLSDPSNKSALQAFRRLEEQARKAGVATSLLDGRTRSALAQSFEKIKRDKLQGFVVSTAALLLEHRDLILQFAARERLPVVYGRREYADAGGLLSYSVDLNLVYRRGADFVYRILQGARPADLPVEQGSATTMTLNAKTARALGIAIPATVRARADEVIE